MIDFVGKWKWYFGISGLIILVGIISIAVLGLSWGVDFTSGTSMTIRFEQQVKQEELRQELTALGHSEAIIQTTGEGDFLIRTARLEPEERDPQTGEVTKPAEGTLIAEALEQEFGPLEVTDYNDVSSTVAKEIGRNTIIAVIAGCAAIGVYITWAFRKLMRPFRYGVCAVVALIHDVIIVFGMYALIGAFYPMDIDVMFITGILTVIGYSVNDVVVVFDRIRENTLKNPTSPLGTTINAGLNETLARSLNTGLGAIFVLLALFLFGGATLHNFMFVLLVGIISGTYSSIAIASPLLLFWPKRGLLGFIRRAQPSQVPLRRA